MKRSTAPSQLARLMLAADQNAPDVRRLATRVAGIEMTEDQRVEYLVAATSMRSALDHLIDALTQKDAA